MSESSRLKKRLYVSAIYVSAFALGLTAGSVGIAVATTGATPDSSSSADGGSEVQEPAYTGSIQAPAEDESLNEADEATQLQPLATISADDAAAAASAVTSGDVGKVELDSENGTVVYSVEITDSTGAEIDVKVDAGEGTILDQQTDGGDDETDDEAGEGDYDDIEDENEQGAGDARDLDDD